MRTLRIVSPGTRIYPDPATMRTGLPLFGAAWRGALTARLEQVDHPLRLLFDRVVGGEPQVGVHRRLIRAVDAGELGDLARARLCVQPLRVTLLAFLDRRVTEHLDEVEAGIGVHFTSKFTLLG